MNAESVDKQPSRRTRTDGGFCRATVTSIRLGATLLAVQLGSSACSGGTTPATLPAPDTNMGLGDVVMMTWTTRSTEGLLGHVELSDPEIGVDPHRCPIDGDVTFDSTNQTLKVVLSIEKTAGLGAGYGPVGGRVEVGQLTHIAYDVRITGYASILPKAQHYLSDSGCCMDGVVSDACGQSFVARMMRGTGTVEYLQQVEGKVSVDAAQILRAEGGATFRKLSSSEFEDTYFAYELMPLQSICGRLSADEEMPTIRVAPLDNCFLNIFHRDGTRTTKAYHMPNADLCQKVVNAACHEAVGVIECQGRHGRDEKAVQFALQSDGALQSGDAPQSTGAREKGTELPPKLGSTSADEGTESGGSLRTRPAIE